MTAVDILTEFLMLAISILGIAGGVWGIKRRERKRADPTPPKPERRGAPLGDLARNAG